MPGLGGEQIRWMLLDTAPRLLPELHQHLSRTAGRVLRRRGVEVRTGQSVAAALDDCWVQLSTGEKVATHSLIWCVGVRADPLVVASAASHRRAQRGPRHRGGSGRIQIDAYCQRSRVERPGGAHAEPTRGIGGG
jgi:NADH dehydrogenase FAD-containing subunit